ncbi:MAG TPA: zinc ribbon domain-containing protein [Vicinamibacterales bacterium]|nr:zinc ribbon domain-containing protein [Vicinamibacterales bacterium]
MSSETSTSVATAGASQPSDTVDSNLKPWQFFVLAALGCATAVTFLARGEGVTVVVLLSVLMGTAALVGMAALRMFQPLVSKEDDRTVMIGQRTRVALEREKALTLRSIKELDFDHAMGKLSDEDWREMSGRLRGRAAGLMKQLDAGVGYREQVERDLAKRLGSKKETSAGQTPSVERSYNPPAEGASNPRTCAQCSTVNDADARFCKGCGAAVA